MVLLNDRFRSLLSILGFACSFVGAVLPYWSHSQKPCLHSTCTSEILTSLFYVKNCTSSMGCWYKTFYDPILQEQYFGDTKGTFLFEYPSNTSISALYCLVDTSPFDFTLRYWGQRLFVCCCWVFLGGGDRRRCFKKKLFVFYSVRQPHSNTSSDTREMYHVFPPKSWCHCTDSQCSL